MATSQAQRVQAQMRLLVRELLAIADQAGFTEEKLIRLEKVLNNIGGTGQFTPKMAKVATAINEIAGALAAAGSPNRVAGINNVRQALFQLAKDYEKVGLSSTEMYRISQMPVGPAQTRAGMEYRNEQAIRSMYLQQAAMTMKPQELAGMERQEVFDTIGARATGLRLADETQSKLLEQAIQEKKITDEVERRAAVEQQQIELLKQAVELRIEATRVAWGFKPTTAAGGGEGRAERDQSVIKDPDIKPIGEILQQYRGFIGTDVGVENLRKKMEALGITNARIVSPAMEDLSTGVRTFSFAIEKSGGAVGRATIRLDRFGNVMRDVGTRYRTWSSAISNNLIKVVQWGLATGVVYGAMQGLKQVLGEITAIENELANVQIALGKSTGDLNTVFKEAATVADLTSTSIKGVIEGYTLAYQAAGAFEDPVMRTAAANSLLQESMILATLAGINQAEAMDTLVGALRQTGQELTNGRELLDRWVAVSRESNVSLNTLAATYSIVGATATGLGLTFEQLNALTATLAEATGLSATETGNAIRGIVAGFQSTQAENVLERFGVQTRKATGELRDFWGLLNEVSTLLASGAISPAELTEIANAIGGGYRRGAQVQTILEGMARAQQLVGVQMNASGEAADALEIKMATLVAAIQRLGNAFTGIARTLGDEGGFLFIAKGAVNVLTFFVTLLNDLVGGLGKATPALLVFGAAWLALQSGQVQGLLNRPAGGLLMGAAGLVRPRGAASLDRRLPQPGGQPQTSIRGALGTIRPETLSALAIVGPAVATLAEAIKKSPAEQGEVYNKVGIQVAGGIAGALIAGPVGAILGSTIGGAFADSVIDNERNIGARLAEIFIESAREAGAPPAADEEIPAGDVLDKIADELPQKLQDIADRAAAMLRVTEFISPLRGSGAFEAPETAMESSDLLLGGIYRKLGEDLPSDLAERLKGLDIGIIDVKIVPLIEDEDIEGASDAIEQLFEQTIQDADIAGAFRAAVEAGTPGMEAAAGDLVGEFVKESQRQFILGELDISDLVGISETSAEGLASTLQTLKQAVDLTGADVGVNELIQSYLDLDDASRLLIANAANAVGKQADVLDYYKETGKSVEVVAKQTELYNNTLRTLADLQSVLSTRQVLERVEERPIISMGRLTPEQIQQVRVESERLRDEQAEAFAEGSEEGAALWVERLGDVLIRKGEGIGEEFFTEFFDQDPGFITKAIENLGLEDAMKEATQFGLRDLRDQLGVADFPALMRRYEQVKSTITSVFPDYDVQEESQGLILKDGFRTIHADMTLFNLAMQDLIDINESQLEGVWNLPSGMTAFVAWSSLYSRNISSGGGGLTGDFPTTDIPEIVETAGGRATPPPTTGRVFTDADMSPELLTLKDKVDRLDTLVDLGARGAGVGVQDYAALKEDAEVARGEYMAAFNQAVRDTNLGMGTPIGGAVAAQPTELESIIQGFQEAFQLENKIELNASIRLVVDGRTLANVVKQYLFTDLVQATDRSMGGGGGYVIEAE